MGAALVHFWCGNEMHFPNLFQNQCPTHPRDQEQVLQYILMWRRLRVVVRTASNPCSTELDGVGSAWTNLQCVKNCL